MSLNAEKLEDISIEIARRMQRRVTRLTVAVLDNVKHRKGLTLPERRVVSLLTQRIVQCDLDYELAIRRPPEWLSS